jgi:hypothetical protein
MKRRLPRSELIKEALSCIQDLAENSMLRLGLAGACLGLSFLLGQTVGGQEPVLDSPVPAIHCLEQLASLSWSELDQLYRSSQAGSIPHGFARGKVVYPPCERFSHLRSHCAGMMWKGKHFCPEQCALVNQWLGVRAIRARIYYGPSWLDGNESIILDYCGESHVWADVRDEMREVAPGLYLGAMILRQCPQPKQKLFFCLEADHCK